MKNLRRKRKTYSRRYSTGTVCQLPFKKKPKRKTEKKKRAYKLLEEEEEKSAVPSTIIVREKEIVTEVMVNCPYCGALMKSGSIRCPNCGAPRRR